MWRTMTQMQHQEGEPNAGSDPGAGAPDPNAAPGGGGGAPPEVAGAPPATDWRASLGTDLAKEKVFDTIKAKDWTEAGPLIAKQFVDAHKMVGNSIQLPKKDAKPEDLAKWREGQWPKLVTAGLVSAPPKTAAEYALTAPNLPNLPPLSDTRVDFYKTGFHKLGITQEQAQGILTLHATEISQGLHLVDTANQDAIDKVEERWGSQLFTRRWALATRALPVLAESVGMDVEAVKTYLDTTRKGNDPVLFQLLAAVGEALDEDAFFDGQALGIGGPEQAKAKIEEIRGNPKHPWHHENHPDHAKALKEMEDLYKLRDGTGAGVRK